nr:glycerol-3-phosphate dehydrogenase C-terminal domain-containing protein [Conexibacter sp. W3-3-2]
MAQDAVDVIAARPGVAAGPCRTAALPLVGAPPAGSAVARGDLPARLPRRYGTEAAAVAALADGRPELLRPLVPEVPVTGAELLFAARSEGAMTLADVLDRRTRAGLVPAWRDALHDAAAQLLPQLAATVPATAPRARVGA